MLQELLEKNQITQQALAEKLNVSQQAVSKWNKRISTPNPNQIDICRHANRRGERGKHR